MTIIEAAEQLKNAWETAKQAGAIGIHEANGIVNVHFAGGSKLPTNGEVIPFNEQRNQESVIVNGVRFFKLVDKEVAV